MTNFYVEQMRDVINSFYAKEKESQKQIKSAKEKYSPEYLGTIINDLEFNRERDYNTAKMLISDIFTDIREYLSISNFPNVAQLTGDRLLFSENSGIDLTVQEVETFIERYKDNCTMLRVITNWLEKNHSGMNGYTTLQKKIVMPIDKLETYKKFAESALSLIDTIYNTTDVTGLELMINSYADENFAKELFDKIGDGRTLKETSKFQVPENAKHTFDYIEL